MSLPPTRPPERGVWVAATPREEKKGSMGTRAPCKLAAASSLPVDIFQLLFPDGPIDFCNDLIHKAFVVLLILVFPAEDEEFYHFSFVVQKSFYYGMLQHDVACVFLSVCQLDISYSLQE